MRSEKALVAARRSVLLAAALLVAAVGCFPRQPTEAETVRATLDKSRAAYDASPPAHVPSREELDAEAARKLKVRRENVGNVTLEQLESMPDSSLLPEERARFEKLYTERKKKDAADKAAKVARKKAAVRSLEGAAPLHTFAVLRAFVYDQPAANALYRNRSIAVAGVIRAITRSDMGLLVSLDADDGDTPNSVGCLLSDHQKGADELAEGQLAALRGTVSGGSLYSPLLLQCRIVPLEIWNEVFSDD